MIYVYLILSSILAGFIQSSGGFGLAIILMAIWTHFLPFMTASIIENSIAILLTGYIMIKKWRYIDWKLIFPCSIAAMLASFLGVDLIMNLDEEFLNKILGIVLMVLGIYFVLFSSRIKILPTTFNGIIAGLISGFSAGLFNIGGPPMVAYFLSVTDDKEKYHATLQAYFTIISSFVVLNHLVQGNITEEMISFGFFSIIGMGIGAFAGLKVFDRLSMRGIKIMMYSFIT